MRAITKITALSATVLIGFGMLGNAPAQARGEGAVAAGVIGGLAAGALASQAYQDRGYGYRGGYRDYDDGYRPAYYDHRRSYRYRYDDEDDDED